MKYNIAVIKIQVLELNSPGQISDVVECAEILRRFFFAFFKSKINAQLV